jgi:DNA (cytosine-5)-methyltransferase 1
MTHGSLFSGIGGFDLAAQWCGWTNVFQCENDPFCQRVLKYHFPKTILYEDIKETDFTRHRGTIDVISGGFPCQPFSDAGKRKGTDDDRYLWPEMLRVIHEIQPTWVVAENVNGLLTIEKGLVFERVCADMEAEGYEVQAFIIPACAVGAPHRRERVWIIANRADAGIEGVQSEREDGIFEPETFTDANSNDAERYRHGEAYCPDGETESKRIVAGVGRAFDFGGERITTDTDSIGSNRSTDNCYRQEQIKSSAKPQRKSTGSCGERTASDTDQLNVNLSGFYPGEILQLKETGILDNKAVARPDGERRERITSDTTGERLQGSMPRDAKVPAEYIPDWRDFPTQSPVCCRDDGFSGRLDGITFPAWRNGSIHALGNAVVPQLMYEIFKIIRNIINLKI